MKQDPSRGWLGHISRSRAVKRKTAVILLIIIAASAVVAAAGLVLWATHVPLERKFQIGEAKRLGLPVEKTVDLPFGRKIELVLIPAGEFLMGSAAGDPGAEAEEMPRHRVRISKPFYMGKYEVTQDQYAAVMRANPSFFGKDVRCPVDSVSWDDARTFCEKANRGLRLPTEAEWEYACRAGSDSLFGVTDEPSELLLWAWFKDTSGGRTHVVGERQANDWGLHDMLGNVMEWCSDWFAPYDLSPAAVTVDPRGPAEGDKKTLRGGAFNSEWPILRCGNRSSPSPDGHSYNFGFRVVQDIQ